MKEGWKLITLGEACEKGSSNVSQNQLTEEIGDYPIYGASGFIKNVSFYHHTKPYLTIVKDGSGVGRVTKMDAFTSVIGTLQYIIPKEDIDLNYLYYSLISIDFRKYIAGAAIPHIYFKDYKNEPFLWMPLSEQLRIVSILDNCFSAIDKAKANAEKNLQNARELFESYLQGVFEGKGEGWEETSLYNETNLIIGFAFKSKMYTNNNEDVLLIKGDNIMQGYFRWDDVKRWDKNEYDMYQKYQLQKNDILLAMDRPWVKSGLKIAIISDSELPSLLVQRTACLRSNKNIEHYFIFYLMNSKKFINHLFEAQTGIGVPHISGKQITDFKFFRPPIHEQQFIVRRLDALRAETQKLESVYRQKLSDLEELKKSLLEKAFRGELS
jgi:type I restriction enzyme S subunit